MEVLPRAPTGGFEQTSEDREDEESGGHDKDQSKYPSATTNTTVMPCVELAYLTEDLSFGRRPSERPVLGSVPWVVASFGKRGKNGPGGRDQTTGPDDQTRQEDRTTAPSTRTTFRTTKGSKHQKDNRPDSQDVFLLVDNRSSGASQLPRQHTSGTSTLFTSLFERFSGRRPQHVVVLGINPDARRDNTDT